MEPIAHAHAEHEVSARQARAGKTKHETRAAAVRKPSPGKHAARPAKDAKHAKHAGKGAAKHAAQVKPAKKNAVRVAGLKKR